MWVEAPLDYLREPEWSTGRGKAVEHIELVQHRGILYITNQRIVFQAKEWGFDKTYRYLTAITPYSDACEMQFGNKSYCMIVADGSVVNQVLQLIKTKEADTIMEGQLKKWNNSHFREWKQV